MCDKHVCSNIACQHLQQLAQKTLHISSAVLDGSVSRAAMPVTFVVLYLLLLLLLLLLLQLQHRL
jgi:hypothetical protein